MNSTGDSSGFLGSNNFSGFSYGVGVSVGILILITTITLASYFCSRTTSQDPGAASSGGARALRGSDHHLALDVGLDEEVIRGYPKMLYSEVNKGKHSGRDSCCAVCLADYKGTDRLRMLPDCSHLFHRRCIDPWLRINPTCPVCRTSPLPTPLSTPLAEVVPLAAGRQDQGRSEFEY